MNTAQFLKALAETHRRKWTISGGHVRIHTARYYCCPITAVANQRAGYWKYGVGDWARAARAIGLPKAQATRIIRAADSDLTAFPTLRAKLLAAVGFKPLESTR